MIDTKIPSTNAAKVAPGLVVDPDATMSAADALGLGALCVGIEALGETSVTLRFAVTGAPATVAYVICVTPCPRPPRRRSSREQTRKDARR